MSNKKPDPVQQCLVGARKAGLGLCLLLVSASCVPGADKGLTISLAQPAAVAEAAPPPDAAPPSPPLLELQRIAPDAAVAMNAAIPVAGGYNPAAARFSLHSAGMVDRIRSLECLTTAIYYEAASESDDGQRAVAQVVLNRVRHPAYPSSVCGVVYQGSERSSGCQFSFTCDGSLARTPSATGWARARRIAAQALAGSVYAPVGHATHYHTQQVLPHWAPSLVKSAVIGAHIFYRWNGGWGTPGAFRQRYAGVEPLPGPKPTLISTTPLPSTEALRTEVAALLKLDSYSPDRLRPAVPEITEAAPAAPAPDSRYVARGLPESQVLDAWKHSGMPRDQVAAPSPASASR